MSTLLQSSGAPARALPEPGTSPGPATTGLVTPPRARRSARPRWLTFCLRSIGPITLLLAWWIGTATGFISDRILASPADVVDATRELWDSGELADAIGVSLWRAVQGLVLGAGVGLVLGIVSGLARLGEELVDPVMQMLRTVPFLALVPLFIVWFGIGETPKILLVATACAFPMYLNTYGGVRNVDRKLIEAARAFGLSGLRLLREIVIPAALPQILVGLRFAMGIAVVALIAAETVNASSGIGHLTMEAREFYRTDILMVCLVLYALLGLTADLIVRLLERFLMPWRSHSVHR